MRFPTAAALLCLALAAGAGAAPAAAQDDGAGDVFPFPVHRTVLDNGLHVVVIPYDSPGVVAYYSVVRTGSREEVEPGYSGFAHFFEHMMFRGTETFPQDAYTDALKAIGADSNAFTTDDWTNYFVVGPAAELETIMTLESDRFINLRYTEAEFRTEAQAVLGEYNMNASNPFRALHERLRKEAFEKHTYEHTTLGFLEDIMAMPGYYDYSLRFFDRFYRPENVIVLVVGDAEPERVFSLVRKYYGAWQPGYKPVEIATEPPQTERRVSEIDWPNPTRPHVMMGWHVPGFDASTVDTAALDLVSQLLFSENAPLYQELVVERQLVDSIAGGAPFRRDPYLFTVTARLRSRDALGEVEATVARYIAGLQKEPVDRERLDRIKSYLRYELALAMDSAPSVAVIVAEFLNLTAEPESINRLYDQYQGVTPEDVQRVTREVFRDTNQTVVRLAYAGPGSAEAATEGETAEGGE